MNVPLASSFGDVPEGPVDLAIVGAGPAGLRAAITAAENGLAVLLIDDHPAIGGQIHHGLLTSPLPEGAVAAADRDHVRRLDARIAALSIHRLRTTSVWSIEPTDGGFELGVTRDGAARLIGARRVILATGTHERPLPIPGWTLPGVLTAGAAQRALKAQGLVPDGRVVLAGSGPLLLLVASQLLAAGAEVVAVVDTTPHANLAHAAAALPRFLPSPPAARGLRLAWTVARGTELVLGARDPQVSGEGRASGLSFVAGRHRREIAADVVLLHAGLLPDTVLARAAGCDLAWDETLRGFRPVRDDDLETSRPGLAIAGDGGDIGGAEIAALEGEIAALAAARALGRTVTADRRAALHRRRRRLARSRAFVDRLWRIGDETAAPTNDATIVCRCESLTAGAIAEAAADPCLQPDQIKSLLRVGMGPCHGRQCLTVLTEIVARERGLSPSAVGLPRARTPAGPLRLGELAELEWSRPA
ncbi:FAD-dependent oxidoreductase [Pinisolibacter aquiterrae]|uniref:FAD-dependent oxidoreductase n=1 Tax=Pinisolibacter aquiterrae TaxID=2815579 RepID=UPI001C3D8BB0|nr:FAD-dependent oxidoreductase [Pinisolibacter aquiterrae]MBV5265429.1 FAD-dependent oxidoreductase [Pinisolibacter aquiterrae]MCC8236062.1 FAD-dependent oxidoreductase [Pinisolibacter aquiterrae]